jgi:HlyD family secretion protein
MLEYVRHLGRIDQMKNGRRLLFIAICSLLVLTFTACSSGGNQNPQQQTEVIRGNLVIKANGSGKVNFENDANVDFGTGGKIAKLYVKEGDLVKKGDLIAQLETQDLELALSQAKLSAAQIELTIKQTSTQIDQAEANIQAAQFNLDRIDAVGDINQKIINTQAAITTAKENLKFARATSNESSISYLMERLKELDNELAIENNDLVKLLGKDEYSGVAPYEVMTYDPYTQNYYLDGESYSQLVVADIQMKQQQVDLAKKSLEQINQNLEVNQLSLENARKAVAFAEKQLKDASISAPIDGKIMELNVHEGDIVSSTLQIYKTLAYIIDPGSIHIDANIDEIDIPSVSVGQKVIISLDSAPDTELEGIVRDISLQPAVNTQNAGVVVYEVKIDFSGQIPAAVKLGMSATVDIITDQRSNVLLIPSRAIKEDEAGRQVVELIINETSQSQIIQTGITDGLNTEVLSGLKEGDIISTSRTTSTGLGIFGQ